MARNLTVDYMLRNKPVLKYSGLTCILSNPGRFDKVSLLSSTGGVLFNDLIRPEFNTMQCDIRVMEDKSDFLPNTKCILLLGEHAMHEWCEKDTHTNSLNEMRGSPLYVRNIPAIASFFPQDAADIRGYEQQYNEESKEYTGEEDSEENEDEGDVKRHSNTKRSNYGFWLKSDIDKCKKLLKLGASRWPIEAEPEYRIYAPAEEVVNALSEKKDHFIGLDIETDYEQQNLLCFAFSFYRLDTLFSKQSVWSVPVLNNNYQPAYSSLRYIIQALVKALKHNTAVAHNGASFDFFVFGYKYHIPVYKCYDTMLAQHRCFPDIEKSLGHGTSLWTYQRFHKDSDSKAYFTHDHMMDKLRYCAKDVFTMSLIHKGIDAYARTIPGLRDSIECANRSIRPYLIATLQGIRYSQEKVDKLCNENDRLMMQYLRIINMLIGPTGVEHCKKSIKSKKPSSIPRSNDQCCDYFHEQLGYPVLFRSTKTQKPSLGKQIMYKLALRYPDNPVIMFILMYRTIAKEYSALRFYPWKDDNNKVIPYIEGDDE